MDEVKDIFDIWNEEKRSISVHSDRNILFQAAEIWWCSIGYNVGTESYGKGEKFMRPVLIIKKLNNESCICLPITTKNKYGSWYVQISFQDRRRVVLLNQIRMVHKNRFQRRMGSLSDSEFLTVKEKLRDLLELF